MAHDDSDSGYSPQNFQPARTAGEAQAQLEQLKQNSQQQLISSISVHEDRRREGHYRWLWFEVPKEIVPLANYFGSTMPMMISKWAGNSLYDISSNVYKRIYKIAPEAASLGAHKAGLRTSAAFATALIAAQPVFGITNAIRDRRNDRKEIRAMLANIYQTDKAGYQKNEVIKTALENAQQHMVDGIKHVAADLPAILMSGYFAYGDHKQFAAGKDKTFNKNVAVAEAAVTIKGKNSFDIAWEKHAKKLKEVREEITREYKANPDFKGLDDAALKPYIEEDYRAYKEAADEEFQSERNRTRGDNAHGADQDKTKKLGDTEKFMAVQAAGGVGLLFKGLIKKDAKDSRYKTAYDLIVELKKEFDAGSLQGANIKDKITEIFQHNEKDRGRSMFGTALLEKFDPLADRLAEVVSGGELDPLALVNLVGDGSVVNNRRFVSTDKLEELIDAQRKVFSLHEKTPLDEFLADFQNPGMIMKAVKENLQTLPEREKSIFASLLSDDVLLHSGIKKTEILSLRKQGHDHMYEFVKATTVELAKKTPEELKAQGLSEKQIESINSLNELLGRGDEKEIKATIDRGDEVLGAVRNATLTEQIRKPETGKKLWSHVIKPAPAVSELAKEKPPEDEESAVAREEKRRSTDGADIRPGGVV